jgi:hypothetical protein
VDDLLALVLLAHARELSLKGVTTVYGDTLLRARIAATAWQRTGNPEILIIPKGWQYRTRALTEDLVLDLGPDCYNDWYDIVPKAGKKCRK